MFRRETTPNILAVCDADRSSRGFRESTRTNPIYKGILPRQRSTAPENIQRQLAERRLDGEKDIRERFERAAAEGDLPDDADPANLAKHAATLLWGISVQAVTGASREDLKNVAKIAIDAFPSGKKTA